MARAKALLYTPEAAAADGATEEKQATAYAAALKLAACQPTVNGVLFDRLVDGAQAGAQAGLFYPDGGAKASLSPLKPLLAQARRGTIAVCPGLGAQVAATNLELPERGDVSGGHPQLDDPLRLLTRLPLPCHARPRGEWRADACEARRARRRPDRRPDRPFRAPLPAGAYRFTVRLISRVNPGPLFAQRSPVFRVGS